MSSMTASAVCKKVICMACLLKYMVILPEDSMCSLDFVSILSAFLFTAEHNASV